MAFLRSCICSRLGRPVLLCVFFLKFGVHGDNQHGIHSTHIGSNVSQAVRAFHERYNGLATAKRRPISREQAMENIRSVYNLGAGSTEHHRAYVGPPNDWSHMGGSMFSLLFFAGLRGPSTLLDVGCGGLRLGRLAMTFLDPGNYHCIEPEKQVLKMGLQNEVGNDLLWLKWPSFAINTDFEPPSGEDAIQTYDFILAHSIFSHTATDLLGKALDTLRRSMGSQTVFLATALVRGVSQTGSQHPASEFSGWLYPLCTYFHPGEFEMIADTAGMHAVMLQWPHPRQTWFVLCLEQNLCTYIAQTLPQVSIPTWQTAVQY